MIDWRQRAAPLLAEMTPTEDADGLAAALRAALFPYCGYPIGGEADATALSARFPISPVHSPVVPNDTGQREVHNA